METMNDKLIANIKNLIVMARSDDKTEVSNRRDPHIVTAKRTTYLERVLNVLEGKVKI